MLVKVASRVVATACDANAQNVIKIRILFLINIHDRKLMKKIKEKFAFVKNAVIMAVVSGCSSVW